jgi:hypothetical protein
VAIQDEQSESGAEPPVENAGDLAALQADIRRLEASVSVATDGLYLHRSEEELVDRLRKRFFQTLMIVAVLSFFGIQAISYGVINIGWGEKLGTSVTEAKVAVALASKSVTELQAAVKSGEKALGAAVSASNAATERAAKAADSAAKKAKNVTARFAELEKDVETSLTKIKGEISGASDSVRAASSKAITDIQGQLVNIQEQLDAVSKKTRVDVADLQEKQIALRTQSEEEQKKFAQNGKFFISVWTTQEESLKLTKTLSKQLIEKLGFRSSHNTVVQGLTKIAEDNGSKKKIASVIVSRKSNIDTVAIEKLINEVLPDYTVLQKYSDEVAYGRGALSKTIPVTGGHIELSDRPVRAWPIPK